MLYMYLQIIYKNIIILVQIIPIKGMKWQFNRVKKYGEGKEFNLKEARDF